MILLSAGCSGTPALSNGLSGSQEGGSRTDEKRDTVQECYIPEASGIVTFGNDSVSIDASHTAEGYVMVCYRGSADKVRLRVTTPDATAYNYALSSGSFETFPLTGGDGNYRIDILEHAYDNMYAIAFSQDITATLNDEFKPFLYPNQYVWFAEDFQAVAFARTLSDESSDDLDYLEKVYLYIMENIDYDEELAANVKTDYLPDIDRTLAAGKGICFDYASLMAAMLRSQGIPTKLVVGYSGQAYHAWISVYLKEIGWVDNIIWFDGKSWSLVDPTLAANNSASSVRDYIGDGSNYTVKYSY